MGAWGKVLDITEVRTLNDKGEPVLTYRYRAETKKGTIFTLTVPEEAVEQDKVGKLLETKAQKLDSTLSL